MSYKVEVQVTGDPKWYDNAIRLATEEEAEAYARDLFSRWLATTAWRVVESEEPVNYRWTDKGLEGLGD